MTLAEAQAHLDAALDAYNAAMAEAGRANLAYLDAAEARDRAWDGVVRAQFEVQRARGVTP